MEIKKKKIITKEQRLKMQAGRKKKKEEEEMVKLLFKCKNYIIEEVFHNYRITIKCARKGAQGIDRDWYSILEFGIEGAHEMADYAIEEFFIKDKKPRVPKNGFKKQIKH